MLRPIPEYNNTSNIEMCKSPIKFWSFSSINISRLKYIKGILLSFNHHINNFRCFSKKEIWRLFPMDPLNKTEGRIASRTVTGQVSASVRNPQRVAADSDDGSEAFLAQCDIKTASVDAYVILYHMPYRDQRRSGNSILIVLIFLA